jgi:hypothetical protein
MLSIDYVLLALWLALTIRTNAALLPLFILLIDLLCFSLFDNDFPRYCIAAITCFQFAQLNINLSSNLRRALLLFGLLYSFCAVDIMLYNHLAAETAFYTLVPGLVIALNAYIAALLFVERGHKYAGFANRLRGFAYRCVFRL